MIFANKCLNFSLALVATLGTATLSGCASKPRTLKGGVAGAVVGGVVGAATGGAKGAAIGAAAGGVTGAAVGAYLDKRRDELAEVVQTTKTDQGLLVTMKSDILFDFDKATLKPEAQKVLGELATILVKYPKDELQISGFTDDIGTADYNQQLSARRAQTVREYLASQGVPAERVAAVGRGEAQVTTKTADARARARRVEIYIDPNVQAQAE